MRYQTLLTKLKGMNPTWNQLLQTDEWLELKGKMLIARNFKCERCGLQADRIERGDYGQIISSFDINEIPEAARRLEMFRIKGTDLFCLPIPGPALHVHHRAYHNPIGLPWEYSEHELEVLCKKCHAKQHGK